MKQAKKILAIVTNITHYENGMPTGLWLSELTHLYDEAKKHNWEITIASPQGGNIPIDPESLKPLLLDKISKQYYENADFRKKLEQTKSLSEVENNTFDLVYLAGGHGTMYDFPTDETMQKIIATHYENGKKIGAICHGVGGLLHVKLSDGNYLIKNKEMTGFSWFEETLANRKKAVPFNLELELKKRNPNYRKAFIPMTSKVVVDGNLITGQNPFSSKSMAKIIVQQME